jgi:hypothetical protein
MESCRLVSSYASCLSRLALTHSVAQKYGLYAGWVCLRRLYRNACNKAGRQDVPRRSEFLQAAAQETVPNRKQRRRIILPDSYQLPLPVGLLAVLT